MYYRGVPKKRKAPFTVSDYFKDYFYKTSVAGMKNFVASNRHPLEKCLWFGFIVFGMVCSAGVIMQNWQRFTSNPTVVSLEKDFRDWEFETPAVTVCFQERVNETRGESYIDKQWGVTNGSQKEYYMRFVNAVANMSYRSLTAFKEFAKDRSVMNIDMNELVRQVHIDHKIVNSALGTVLDTMLSTNEMGFCVVVGSMIEPKFSGEPERESPTQICSFSKGLCTLKIKVYKAIQFSVHSAHEFPNAVSRAYRAELRRYYLPEIRSTQTVPSPEVRDLPIEGRGCRYQDENDDPKLPIYTYNLCRMKCRRSLAINYCGCAPAFYKQLNDIEEDKICDVEGLICLSEHAQNILKLNDKKDEPYPCHCYDVCESNRFEVTKDVMIFWRTVDEVGNPVPQTIVGYVVEFGRTRFRRDVVFTFGDLLVSFGGTAGFFLGCSILSIVEVVYFFTIRLFWYLWRRRQFATAPEPRRRRFVAYNMHQ